MLLLEKPIMEKTSLCVMVNKVNSIPSNRIQLEENIFMKIGL